MSHLEKSADIMMNVIKKKPEWIDYVKNFNQMGGFLFCKCKTLDELEDAILKADDSHTGASFALTLRICQSRLRR